MYVKCVLRWRWGFAQSCAVGSAVVNLVLLLGEFRLYYQSAHSGSKERSTMHRGELKLYYHLRYNLEITLYPV